jgi:hypothetical protein
MPINALAEPRRGQPEPDGVESMSEPISEADRCVSEATYWRDYYPQSDIHYEWNNGHLEEKPVSDYETFLVYKWFMALLEHFLRTQPIAKLVGLEMGFRLPLPTGTVIRKPDLALVRNDNPRPLLPRDASYRGVFDLCVEALSDKERRGIERDTLTKKAEYAAGGVPEYYILHQAPEHQACYSRAATGLYLPIPPQDGVIHSQVLPGFRFRLADLCTQPSVEAMQDDPIYAEFVLPEWREARQLAAAEATARKQAEARAQEAEQAVARLQAQLRALQGSD